MPKRVVPDFIEAYKQYLEGVPGPPQFKEWAALWTISAAMERRVWTITQGDPCFANLYILMVGPSGCGKGVTLRTARTLVGSLGSDRLSASSMTAAYFQQALSENERSFVNPVTKEPEPYNALHVHSPEMMVLFPAQDNDLFANMTDAWDCDHLSVGRIAKDRNAWLDRVCVTALFATTPVHINDLITKNAWHGGFMSRVIMLLGEAERRQSAFIKSRISKGAMELLQSLKETIKHIATLQGEFAWTDEAREAFDAFYTFEGNLGGPPIPSHPNLATYCIRRHQQIEKIMMCRRAGIDDSLLLTLDDYKYAHELLLNAEALMPDIFHGANLDSPFAKAEKVLFELYKWQNNHPDSIISQNRIFQEIHKKITFFNEAQSTLHLLINSEKLQKIPELKLTKKQRDRDANWYRILGGTLETDQSSIVGDFDDEG